MKKLNKKGFTIVELVIVIAVIAILAAVLIPTFSGVVDKANNSAALQTARSTLTNALNMSSNAQLAGKTDDGKWQTVIVVDGKYAFGYNGNQLEQIDFPGAAKSSVAKLSNTSNFNAILIAAENLNDGVNNADSASFIKTNDLKIKNVAEAITSASAVNGSGTVLDKQDGGQDHYYLNYTDAAAAYFDSEVASHCEQDHTHTSTCIGYFAAKAASYDAEVFINSDFAKNVVVFTTFSK